VPFFGMIQPKGLQLYLLEARRCEASVVLFKEF
jgi:hypothetical protein